VTSQPFETSELPDDVSPASATVLVIGSGSSQTVVTETVNEGLWMAPWSNAAGPLAWTQVTAPAALPGGAAQEVAYVQSADALFLTGIGTLSRLDDPTKCVAQLCPLTAVPVPAASPAGWTPLTTSYGNVPIASDGDDLFVVAGPDITVGKPGTVFQFDPSAPAATGWTQLADPDAVAANQMVRPLAVAAENGRLAITTSGNGLVVYD